MRYFFHGESCSLFTAEEHPNDGLSEEIDRAQYLEIALSLDVAVENHIVAPRKPNIGAALSGGNTGSRARHDADFYPTDPPTTRSILPYLADFPNEVWEFACGEGDMGRVLEAAGYRVVGTDLHFRGYGTQLDFLQTTKPLAKAAITNPPFNLADEIIEHARGFLGLEYLALILPLNFYSAKSRLRRYFEDPPTYVCPHTWRIDVTGAGRPTMNCMWVVWTPDENKQQFCPLHADKYAGRFDPCR